MYVLASPERTSRSPGSGSHPAKHKFEKAFKKEEGAEVLRFADRLELEGSKVITYR